MSDTTPPDVPVETVRPRLGPTLFVWGTWLSLVLFALGFVAVYGSNVPYWDDASLIPQLAGAEGVTLGWLWAPHNEHRIPLPKLLCVALARVSGCDLRAAMTFNVLLLATATATLLVTVRLRRGFTQVSDAVFPLALLHVGQHQNLLWAFQLTFVAGPVLVVLLLAALVHRRSAVGLLLAVGCVPLLPLCGANGLAFAPLLALWLALAGLTRLVQPGGRALAILLLGAAALTTVFVLLYFVGWGGPHRDGATPGWLDAGLVGAQFLSMAPGSAVRSAWPLSLVVLTGLSVATALLLARAAWRDEDRVRALGLLALLAGFAALAVGVGWGRAHLHNDPGLASRYVTLMSPLICVLYCAWELYLPAARARFPQVFLLLVCAALLPLNTVRGMTPSRERKQALAAIARDARAGASPAELVRRHGDAFCPPQASEVMVEALEILRAAAGPYANAAIGEPTP